MTPVSPTHAAALEYAARGWAVFPIEPPILGDRESGKRPLTGRGKDDATTDTATIDDWWRRRPDANVGIALDKSGLVALDVDIGLDTKGQAKPGRKALEEFDAHLPRTLTAVTGSGGLHALFDAQSAPIHALKLREGLDVIGNGYIVAAPSLHYTGARYRWNDVTAIAPVPDVLRRAVAERRTASVEKVQLIGTPIGEGGRNLALFRLACALRDQGIGAEALARAIDAENKQRCTPPLSDAELAAIVNSALQRVTPVRDVAIGALIEQEVRALADPPPSRAHRIADVAKQQEPPMRFYATGVEELDKLTRGGFATRRVVGVVGPPSMGKSAFVGTIALHMQQQIPVLHFSTELPRKEVQVRYAAPIVGFPWSDGLKGLIPDDLVQRAVAPLNIWIVGCDDYDRFDPIGSLRAEALRIREQTGVAPLIVVDYVQMLARGTTDQVRHKVGELTLSLRMLAQELDCPIIAVFSTSRSWYGNSKEVERIRGANDPSMYLVAAKESGEIEYDCGTIIFLDLDKLAEGQPKPCRGAVARCRDGEIGFVGLRANLATGLWVGDPSALAEVMADDRMARKNEKEIDDACRKLITAIQKMPNRPWRELMQAVGSNYTVITAARAKLLEDGTIAVVDRYGYDPVTKQKLRGSTLILRNDPQTVNVGATGGEP